MKKMIKAQTSLDLRSTELDGSVEDILGNSIFTEEEIQPIVNTLKDFDSKIDKVVSAFKSAFGRRFDTHKIDVQMHSMIDELNIYAQVSSLFRIMQNDAVNYLEKKLEATEVDLKSSINNPDFDVSMEIKSDMSDGSVEATFYKEDKSL